MRNRLQLLKIMWKNSIIFSQNIAGFGITSKQDLSKICSFQQAINWHLTPNQSRFSSTKTISYVIKILVGKCLIIVMYKNRNTLTETLYQK